MLLNLNKFRKLKNFLLNNMAKGKNGKVDQNHRVPKMSI